MNNYWKNKKVLLTGADGFVGSHLSEMLLDLGAKLTIVVRATSNNGTSSYNFQNLSHTYISKCKKITPDRIIISCNTSLNIGDVRIFLSEKKPTKKIKIKRKFKIRLFGFIKIVGMIKKIPPVNGILFSLVVSRCLSPE